MESPRITAKTGNAPIKKLGQTRSGRFGADRNAKVVGSSKVTDEKSGI